MRFVCPFVSCSGAARGVSMGRIAVVVMMFMVVVFVWFRLQSGSPGPASSSKVTSLKQKRVIISNQHNGSGWRKIQRRVLLQVREEGEQRLHMKNQNPDNHTVDDDSPLRVPLPIPTEDSSQRVPRHKLIMELPPNSSCSSSLNMICHTEGNVGLCANGTRCNATSTFIMGGLHAKTLYVLKKHNVPINDCDWGTSNCSDSEKIKKYRPATIAVDLKPGPIDVMLSPSKENCKRNVFYLFKLTLEDNPELKDIHERRSLPCRSLMCVRVSSEKDGSKAYDVQMRVIPAEKVRDRSIPHEEEREMCAQLGLVEIEEQGFKNLPATPAHSDHVWMSGLWAAVGACAGLSLLTLIAICFQKRSVAEQPVQEEVGQQVLDNPLPPDVLIEAQIAALGLDTEPLVENEIFSITLSPDDFLPASRPRTESYTLDI